ncbi:MAG: hypothetical protein CME61_01650 [Halobacteriovoraceae bacterium]|nr:hypothetical protein [Halobacteriovoraceae bacterium]|tara:strand:- start:907 stop:1449 length:543 start_codon:yes stop_codon:yes gene_type:complete
MSKVNRRDLLKMSLVSGVALNTTNVYSSTWFVKNSKTLIALIETIVPGKETDPTKAPGGMEAKTFLYLQKVEKEKLLPLPFGLIKTLISGSLNVMSLFKFRKAFHKLSYAEREIIAIKLEKVPGVHLFYKVIRAPFYTGSINKVGFDYFGYPGPNNGYSDFSFKKKMADAHPNSVGGNLP